MPTKYCIVLFTKSNRVDVTPVDWTYQLNNEYFCYWPPSSMRAADIINMVKTCKSFSTSWKPYSCRILKYYDTYAAAESRIPTAQAASDWSSTECEQEIEDQPPIASTSLASTSRTRGKRINFLQLCGATPEKRPKVLAPAPVITPPRFNSHSLQHMEPDSLIVELTQTVNIQTPSPDGAQEPVLSLPDRTQESQPSSPGGTQLPQQSVQGRTPVRGQSPVPQQSIRGKTPKPQQSIQGRTPEPQQSSPGGTQLPQQSVQGRTPVRGQSPVPQQSIRGRMPEPQLSIRGRTPARHQTPELRQLNHGRASAECSQTERIQTNGFTLTSVDRKFLTLLEEIKQQSQTIIHLQQQILNSRNNEGQPPSSMNGRLPVSTIEELHLINTEAADKDAHDGLARYLGLAGGGSVAETVRAVMKRLMMSVVARQLNWKGKGGKVAFSSLVLKSVVCDAVRRNPVTCRATDNDVANVIKEWLKHSADHDGGRARRQRRSNPHTPAAIPAEN